MKKIKILMLLVFAFLLSACGTKKEALDEENFRRIMTDTGFTIVDVEKQFEEYGYFDDALIALEQTSNYQIEFYELENEGYAKSFYDNNKEIFEASKTDKSIYTNLDLTERNKYTLVTETEYKVISRIEDTVIYINVNKEYKDEVNNILKKLGY